jgi:DNA polymerase-3 subunit delta'
MNNILPWQYSTWQSLQAYISSQRIPQAILLSGSPGLGKRRLADIYAAALLCLEPLPTRLACGSCNACKLLAADTHPDYLVLEPDEPGKAIGIDKIRQLIIKLALKPQFDAWRMVIVQPADLLNTASANAFLKCLEEPTERSCFMLITAQPTKLPATIRSRCQKVAFAAPDRLLAEQWLRQQGAAEDAGQLLRLAHGAPLLAKQYVDREIMLIRRDCFQSWQQLAFGKCSPLLVADAWQKQQNVEPDVLMDWQISWVMDIIKLVHRVDDSEIENQDFKTVLQKLAAKLTLAPLYHYYDKLLSGRALLATQLNRQLLLEQILIDWLQLNTGIA